MTDRPSDKSKFHNALYEGSNREHVGRRLDLVGASTAFQADDEGSIPFTRSNEFNDLYGDLAAQSVNLTAEFTLLALVRSGRASFDGRPNAPRQCSEPPQD
jgi:hypothetical protein